MTKLQFSTEQLRGRLHSKFKDQPFYQAYATTNALSKILSYTFNLLSAFTGFAFVFFFLSGLIPHPAGAGAVTALFLLLLEGLKRTTAGRLFVQFFKAGNIAFMLLLVCAALSGISILFSYQGAKETIIQMTPPPAPVTDARAKAIRVDLVGIDQQISEARSTRWKGTTTSRSQQAIKELAAQKTLLLAELARIEKRTDLANDTSRSRHQISTRAKAEHFAFFTLASELLFLLCIGFCNYYDARSWHELKQDDTGPETDRKRQKYRSGIDSQNPVITRDQQRPPLPPLDTAAIQNRQPTTTAAAVPISDKPTAKIRTMPAAVAGETISTSRTIANTDLQAVQAAITRARGNVSTYRRRLQRAQEKGNNKSIATNQNNFERWKKELRYYENLKCKL